MAFFMGEADSNLSSAASAGPEATHSFRRVLARWWRESVRYTGAWRSLTLLGEALISALAELMPSRRKARFGDLDFDWENSVDTTRSNVSLRTQLLASLTARPYFATEPWLFEQMMQALPIDFARFTFVDLGCGKGRVLLMASEYPFKRITGVEFMPELQRIAERNLAGFSGKKQECREIEAICTDARDFNFPREPLVVYLFNPFSESTFAEVLENLRRSLAQTPRPVYIAYRFTEFGKLLAEAPWLKKIAGTEQWAVHESDMGALAQPNLR